MQHTYRYLLAALSGMIVCVIAAAQPGSYPTRPLRTGAAFIEDAAQFWGPIVKRVGLTPG